MPSEKVPAKNYNGGGHKWGHTADIYSKGRHSKASPYSIAVHRTGGNCGTATTGSTFVHFDGEARITNKVTHSNH